MNRIARIREISVCFAIKNMRKKTVDSDAGGKGLAGGGKTGGGREQRRGESREKKVGS